jgi:hypothetical protein
MLDELDQRGFVLCPAAIGEAELARLLEACVPTAGTEQVRHPSGATYGIRGLLWSNPGLSAELDTAGVSTVARAILGPRAFPVDAIFFDKQQEANWSVPGHQDRMMPVEPGGATPTTMRNGVAYADHSHATLAALVALRVHFDAVGLEDGALEVVRGSHRRGVLATDAIRAVPLSDYSPCVAARGDVLALRPLLLHRSGRRITDGHRRVLHVVYAAEHPPDGSRWRSA